MLKLSKFNNERNSKLNKVKIIRSGIATGLAVIAVGSLAGCGETDPLLKGTVLEDAIVASVDGEKEILRNEYVDNENHRVFNTEDEKNIYHNHYTNVVTGEWLTDSDNCYSVYLPATVLSIDGETVLPRKVTLTNVESITVYLTEDELTKAKNGEFTKDDAIKVITRIKNLPVAETAKEKQNTLK